MTYITLTTMFSLIISNEAMLTILKNGEKHGLRSPRDTESKSRIYYTAFIPLYRRGHKSGKDGVSLENSKQKQARGKTSEKNIVQ